MLQNQKGYTIISLRSNHRSEFENNDFANYCEKNGINHNFPIFRNPKQYGVIDMNNRCLKEMVKSILNESSLPKTFWVNAINIACYL